MKTITNKNSSKNNSIFIFYLLTTALILQNVPKCEAQLRYKIDTNSPTWNASVANTSTPGNITIAGMDYLSSYEILSATDHVKLNLDLFVALGSVKVSVYRQDITPLPSGLNISIKRTGTGNGLCLLCSINNGSNFISITPTVTDFFTVNALLSLLTITNIPIQYKLNGASVAMSGTNYQTRIIYTIAD